MSNDKYIWYWHKARGEVCVDVFLNGNYHNTKVVYTKIYTEKQFGNLPEPHRKLCSHAI